MPEQPHRRGRSALDSTDLPSGLARRRRRRAGPPRWPRIVALLTLVAVLVPLLAGAGFVGRVYSILRSAPDLADLERRSAAETSAVYAADGRLLGFLKADVVRTPVTSRQIPEVMKRATLAIEDRRFYEHEGLDFVGLVRAAAENVRSGAVVQGGSTLTMQLVRALYISRERTFQRKIVEAKLASELERRHSKRWILTTYLNNVSYGTRDGRELVGVHAAARAYFGKPAWRLTLREAALLAGLPQAPSRMNPLRHPERAKARRDAVLRAMVETGDVTSERARKAMRRDLGLRKRSFYARRQEPFVIDEVRRRLVEEYGRERVERGGLKVFTTIQPRLQRRARRIIRKHLGRKGDPEAAVVSIVPRSGRVRAMASSASYRRTRFRLSTQAHRQPGSAFKTMALVAALERRTDPYRTTYASAPIDRRTKRYGKVEVKTYSGTYGDRRTNLLEGTLTSDNTVYTRLTFDLGPRAVRHAAHRMGISTKLQPNLALTLGGLHRGVTPLEMARAYATLAGDGVRAKPVLIRRVEFPDGRAERPEKPHRTKVLGRKTARITTAILRRNVQRGTGTAANIDCPAAGKTGTTDEHKDAWFVGYTRRLATAVWVGYRKPRPMLDVHGIRVAGGTFPARIWGDYMDLTVRRCRGFPSGGDLDPPLRARCNRYTTTPSSRCGTRAEARRRNRARARAARQRAEERQERRETRSGDGADEADAAGPSQRGSAQARP